MTLEKRIETAIAENTDPFTTDADIRFFETEEWEETGFLVLKDGEIVGKEEDLGNAEELAMVLREMHPESVVKIKEFVGCIVESS